MTEPERRPLIEWLLRKYPDTPRGRAKQWIGAGRVTLDGVIMRRPHDEIADPGDALELLSRQSATLPCEAAGWRIHPRVTLLHLDATLAVVNKGPGLISVPAAGFDLSAMGILEDYLAGRLKPRDRALMGKPLPSAFRKLQLSPVHRLDQYTSGVFCMAANPEARRNLIDQLQARTMKRDYVAFVEGQPSQPKGTWRNWLQLTPDELRQRVIAGPGSAAVGPEPVEAVTHYEVVREYQLAGGRVVTQLRLSLESGRKHQIRVQAAHAGLPLVGDRVYNPRLYRVFTPGDGPAFTRQALHAEVLSLEHPAQPGVRMSWRAQWPEDLRELERSLGR